MRFFINLEFPHKKPCRLTYFQIKRCQVHIIVKKYGKMIGIDVYSHTFRHSFTIHLVRTGLDLRRVQRLLEDSNLKLRKFIYSAVKEFYCSGLAPHCCSGGPPRLYAAESRTASQSKSVKL